MTNGQTARDALASRLEERAAEAGIIIAPERKWDVLEGARRLEAAMRRVREFLAEADGP